MRRDLKNAVGRRVDDRLPRSHVFLAQSLDDLGPGGRDVPQGPPAPSRLRTARSRRGGNRPDRWGKDARGSRRRSPSDPWSCLCRETSRSSTRTLPPETRPARHPARRRCGPAQAARGSEVSSHPRPRRRAGAWPIPRLRTRPRPGRRRCPPNRERRGRRHVGTVRDGSSPAEANPLRVGARRRRPRACGRR